MSDLPTPPLPAAWNPETAGQASLATTLCVSGPEVKGAHDSDFICIDGKAYIIYMGNDVQPGEAAHWPFVYIAFSIVDLASGTVEETTTIGAGKMRYDNLTLAHGACFVPRVLLLDETTIRCFFSSEGPGKRSSQTWYIDYDLTAGDFRWELHQPLLTTALGTGPMQPRRLYDAARAQGYNKPFPGFGLYPIDSFKRFDDQIYCALNNFPGGQLAWSRLDDDGTRFTVLGHLNEPAEAKLTETAINRLPDGTLMAISRQENNDHRHLFSTSKDGRVWSPHAPRDVVPDGCSTKSTFDCFHGVYYLGWNAAEQVDGVHRSVFNIDISTDGESWQRAYRLATSDSFQYPVFREHQGTVWFTVTQGDTDASRKERIMLGRLVNGSA